MNEIRILNSFYRTKNGSSKQKSVEVLLLLVVFLWRWWEHFTKSGANALLKKTIVIIVRVAVNGLMHFDVAIFWPFVAIHIKYIKCCHCAHYTLHIKQI